MFEFRLNTKGSPNFIRQANTWDNLGDVRKREAIRQKNATLPKMDYSIKFNDMHANLKNVKAGCRSCRGTF